MGAIQIFFARPGTLIPPPEALARLASTLEKLIGSRARSALLRNVGLNSSNLVMQQLYARTEFFDRQQSEILSNFVDYFFLRLIVLIDHWHGWPPAAEI
jgi:hypothetical protein